MDLNHYGLKKKIAVWWSDLPLIHKIYINVISALSIKMRMILVSLLYNSRKKQALSSYSCNWPSPVCIQNICYVLKVLICFPRC